MTLHWSTAVTPRTILPKTATSRRLAAAVALALVTAACDAAATDTTDDNEPVSAGSGSTAAEDDMTAAVIAAMDDLTTAASIETSPVEDYDVGQTLAEQLAATASSHAGSLPVEPLPAGETRDAAEQFRAALQATAGAAQDVSAMIGSEEIRGETEAAFQRWLEDPVGPPPPALAAMFEPIDPSVTGDACAGYAAAVEAVIDCYAFTLDLYVGLPTATTADTESVGLEITVGEVTVTLAAEGVLEVTELDSAVLLDYPDYHLRVGGSPSIVAPEFAGNTEAPTSDQVQPWPDDLLEWASGVDGLDAGQPQSLDRPKLNGEFWQSWDLQIQTASQFADRPEGIATIVEADGSTVQLRAGDYLAIWQVEADGTVLVAYALPRSPLASNQDFLTTVEAVIASIETT